MSAFLRFIIRTAILAGIILIAILLDSDAWSVVLGVLDFILALVFLANR